MLQVYNVVAVTYNLLQGIYAYATQLCMLWCTLFGFDYIWGPTAVRNIYQTLLLTILVFEVHNADMTACSAAPGSIHSSRFSLLFICGFGSKYCQ